MKHIMKRCVCLQQAKGSRQQAAVSGFSRARQWGVPLPLMTQLDTYTAPIPPPPAHTYAHTPTGSMAAGLAAA